MDDPSVTGLDRRRFAAALFACAVYSWGVGAVLIALAASREPVAGKVYLRGVEFGLELIALSWPLVVSIPLAALVREKPAPGQPLLERALSASLGGAPERSFVVSAFVHWAFTFAVALVFLFPRQLLHPLLASVEGLPQEVVGPAFGSLLLLALNMLFVAVAFGSLRTLGLGVLLFARSSRTASYLLGVAGGGIVLLTLLLSKEDPLLWLRPPATLGPDAIGTFFIAGLGVAFAASLEPVVLRDPAVPLEASPALDRVLATGAMIVLAQLFWLSSAERVLPGGLLPPTIHARDTQGRVAPADTETVELLRRLMVRTGLDAVGETFTIGTASSAELEGFRSDRKRQADGSVVIRIDAQYSGDHARELLSFQLASMLAELRYWPLPTYIRAGYSFWASESHRSPFRGDGAATNAAVTCGDVPRLDLHGRLANDWLAPSSLPFLLRERATGVTGAHQLLHEVSLASIPEWSDVLDDACAALLGDGSSGAMPAVAVEIVATPNGPPPDGFYERRILDEMKERAGLAEGLSRFVIRYGVLPPGRRSASTFPGLDTILVTVSAALPAELREQALRVHFVGDLVSARYGNAVEPFRSGYATWASRDPENPFVTGRPSPGGTTVAVLCDRAALEDLTRGTNATVWLSSLPFVDAERERGAEAARDLFRDAMHAQMTVTDWNARVVASCARLQGS